MPRSEKEAFPRVGAVPDADCYNDGRLTALGAGHGLTGRSWGDMRLAERRRALLARVRAPEPDARMLKQVHGTAISVLRKDGRGPVSSEGDGWITDRPGAVVAVSVADCLPIWIWRRDGRVAGVFHSGWRGLAAGMPGQAVAAFFREFGTAAGELEAFVGPHAGACCYRVGPEVHARFGPGSVRRQGADAFLDLGAEARSQLTDAGLRPDAVAVSARCTICRTQEFYSYRREGRVGQMLAYLWLGE